MPTTSTPYARWHHKDHPRATRLRIRLELLLGGACSGCGAIGMYHQGGTTPLEFHHEAAREYHARKLSWLQRLYRYKHEIQEGKIKVLLCQECHTEVSARRLYVPF